jgi:hypothetical protein
VIGFFRTWTANGPGQPGWKKNRDGPSAASGSDCLASPETDRRDTILGLSVVLVVAGGIIVAGCRMTSKKPRLRRGRRSTDFSYPCPGPSPVMAFDVFAIPQSPLEPAKSRIASSGPIALLMPHPSTSRLWM